MTRPMQPIYIDAAGIARFKANAIVAFLLKNGPFDLNDLATRGFSDEDEAQFAQLIGYSVSGWGDLSYVDAKDVAAADEIVAAIAAALVPTSVAAPKEATDAATTEDKLRALISEAISLHRCVESNLVEGQAECQWCEVFWPCETVRILEPGLFVKGVKKV